MSQLVKRKKGPIRHVRSYSSRGKIFLWKITHWWWYIDFDIEDMCTENEPEVQSFELEAPNNDAQEQELRLENH